MTSQSARRPAPAPSAAPIPRRAVLDVAAILPDWLETLRFSQRQTGLQVALWHEGELVAEVAVGPADEPAGFPLRTTHRLRIASHSKMMTALTIMRLVEQGRLRLDDTLGERVGDLAGTPVADRTLRDLLSHSAGLTRDSPDARWWRLGIPFADRERLLEIARTGAVTAEPGLHLQYSNIGYGLLGLVIEEVTGTSFAEAVTELVLDPVGIDALGPDLPEDAPGPEAADGFAPGHTSLLHGPRRVVEQIPTGALAAATGFWASAGAIASFAGRVLADGALLSPATLREMRRRVWTLGESRHYGLGLQMGRLHGFSAIGHSGGFPTGLSRTWAVPAQRLAVSVIGTAVDAPSSSIAEGVLGLLALAAGRPAPEAGDWERAGAQGGGSDGRERPAVLAEQPAVEVHAGDAGAGAAGAEADARGAGAKVSASELAALVTGTYDSLWGRTRLAVIGDRLFSLDGAAADPASSALELSVGAVRPDPIDPSLTAVELWTWGDPGYGSWSEPILARLALDGEGGAPRCVGLVVTGQVQTPSAEFVMPERVTAP
jgi:CubicO group peptidase (beta-lactamase class C family)